MPRDPLPLPDSDRPPVLVRPAGHGDAGDLVRMIRRLAAQHGERATLGLADAEWDVLGSESWASALVAEAGARPVGCAVVGRHYRTPFAERCLDLGSLFVEPDWRGRAVGRALVAAVMAQARSLGCSRVTVGTAEGNSHARRFYESLGFERAPVRGSRFQVLVSPVLQGA